LGSGAVRLWACNGGDFDFDEDLVHIQRDIDFCGSKAHDGELKTDAADRYVPIPGELRAMLTKERGFPNQYVFHAENGQPWPQSGFKRIWLSLMQDACCIEEREVEKGTKRKSDIIKRLKPALTTHHFRHNYATLLFEAGVEPLIAMKILGHTDYQTTANIYTHLNTAMMKKVQRRHGGCIPS
jgi:integrase